MKVKNLQDVQNIVTDIESNKSVTGLNVFKSIDDNEWNYYFSISGFYYGNYFSLYLTNHKSDNVHETDICYLTEQKTKFKKAFKL